MRKAAVMPPMLGEGDVSAWAGLWLEEEGTYAPATKCGHDFAPGAGLVVTEAAFVFAGGRTSPSSRDCVRVSASMSGFLLVAAGLVDGYWEVMHGRCRG